MATVTGLLTVNAAFLQEIKVDNEHLNALLKDMRDLIREPAVLRNHRQRFLRHLVELRDQLTMHFALEEAYGYFDEAIDVAPRITDRAAELRAEHTRLFELIQDLVDAAEQ